MQIFTSVPPYFAQGEDLSANESMYIGKKYNDVIATLKATYPDLSFERVNSRESWEKDLRDERVRITTTKSGTIKNFTIG